MEMIIYLILHTIAILSNIQASTNAHQTLLHILYPYINLISLLYGGLSQGESDGIAGTNGEIRSFDVCSYIGLRKGILLYGFLYRHNFPF